MSDETASTLSYETVTLIQGMIRNACVNDGTPESGNESRNVALLQKFFAESLTQTEIPVRVEVCEPFPGRQSLIIRVFGSDPQAESLALVGHTDVVPAEDAELWAQDPFAAEIVDGYLWGRGTLDMLTLTAVFAVVTRQILDAGQPPKGDLVYIAVADEEGGSRLGMKWLMEHEPDLVTADYVLSESGGAPIGDLRYDAAVGERQPAGVVVTVGEKGLAPHRIHVSGTAGHGSSPWGVRNAAVIAAEVVKRLSEYASAPEVGERWRGFLAAINPPPEVAQRLLDPTQIDGALGDMGPLAGFAHASTHTTFSPNVISAGTQFNVIPASAEVGVDIRILPGITEADVSGYLTEALGDLASHVTFVSERFDPPSLSQTDNRLFGLIAQAVGEAYPGAKPVQIIGTGGSDLRFYRYLGKPAYGIGFLSRDWELAGYRKLFHGLNERIDLESIELMRTSVGSIVNRFLT